MPETAVHRRALAPRALALLIAPLAAWSAGCEPAPSAVRAPATPAASPPPAAAPAAATAAPVSDWNAAPTNGSPGVNAPKLTGNDLLKNSTFDGGKSIPWSPSFSGQGAGSVSVKDGQLCVAVTNKGVNGWDTQARHREMVIQKGHTYSIAFMAHASKPIRMKAKIGMAGAPYKEYWTDTVDLTTHPQAFVGAFTMEAADDPTAEFAFHFGGGFAGETTAPYTVCLDDIHLDDPQFVKPANASAEEAPVPNVLVNQTGYLPELPKLATVKNPSKSPLKWELHKKGGAVVASGETKPFGRDAASGDDLQIIDFSTYKTPGKDYTLWVSGEGSHPFDIGKDVYKKLKYDALAYFYQTRSGIEIKMPFAGGKQWTRPAGHVNVAPNKGDKDVPCLEGSGCDYKLDVTGGWYDAGDQGKYVVNGGIAAWLLMNEYERAVARGTDGEFKDGKMNIPEKKNKIPDLLDEARWEIAFLLKMQVPDGQPKAGMVHHKVHDKEWTEIGTPPDKDDKPRFLWPPSTAATLNLAATAAQCARVFEKVDKAFAAKCLAAAEKAWTAAQANPAVYAGTSAVGGGPYDDSNVSDEFYWAAAELYITTKKDAYKAFLEKSPFFKKVPTVQGSDGMPVAFDWGNVGALGTISLALVPNLLPPQEIDDCKVAVETAADTFQALVAGEGYRLPFKPGAKGYPWGSNSFVLDNAIVLALASDFSGEAKYRDAAAEAMNYVLGRNPMDKSYVTGYGERPLMNPHHRFWAHQANPKLPPPPPGVLSGGPNSGLQDAYVQAAGLAGCAPEKCYVDHIEAWSANEEAINWNAPLAWVAAFLDEKGEVKAKPRPKTKVKVVAAKGKEAAGAAAQETPPPAAK
ncbi:MAG TPA: glycoside hydrolase family 9 protein [Polyangia bacterium]|nr:glycoside hydrolase family 9 protein [Polyangia bacterium]